jgi:MFS family permease
MEISFTYYALSALGGLVAGGIVGVAFGVIQSAAQRKYELRQRRGKSTSGWLVMPGSFTRVAFLMIALVIVQVLLPSLFLSNIQWLVSAGVVLGYGWILFQQVHRHKPHQV